MISSPTATNNSRLAPRTNNFLNRQPWTSKQSQLSTHQWSEQQLEANNAVPHWTMRASTSNPYKRWFQFRLWKLARNRDPYSWLVPIKTKNRQECPHGSSSLSPRTTCMQVKSWTWRVTDWKMLQVIINLLPLMEWRLSTINTTRAIITEVKLWVEVSENPKTFSLFRDQPSRAVAPNINNLFIRCRVRAALPFLAAMSTQLRKLLIWMWCSKALKYRAQTF